MEAAMVELELTVQKSDEHLDMMACKIDSVEKQMVEQEENPEHSVMQLLQSVSEVRSDYQNLRRELVEVQTLQRELSIRLRHQLQQVQGRFVTLKERLASVPPN